jgi:hypothetical protein
MSSDQGRAVNTLNKFFVRAAVIFVYVLMLGLDGMMAAFNPALGGIMFVIETYLLVKFWRLISRIYPS